MLGGAAARGRRERRRQFLPGRGHHLGRRPRQDPRRRPAPDAVHGQVLRLRVPVQEPVPLRPLRHATQARPRRLRRHRHHLLPVVAGVAARRDRLRVPGERERGTLHGAHQRVQPGEGWPGAAVPYVVRSHQGLPHLLRGVEPEPHRLLRRRHAHPRLPQPCGVRRGGAVPDEPADAGVRERVGRGGVGDAGRARQDGLVQGAVRGVVQGVRRGRVRGERRRGVREGRRRLDVPGARRRRAGGAPAGAGQLHDLRLLHRQVQVPAGPAAGVRRRQVEQFVWVWMDRVHKSVIDWMDIRD